jgi:hypothetical protein
LYGKVTTGIASAEAFINDILYQSIMPEQFWSNGEGYIRFTFVCEEKNTKRLSVDFSLSSDRGMLISSDYILNKMMK